MGIDPGLANTGWGFVETDGSRFRLKDFGVIQTSPGESRERRLCFIGDSIKELVNRFQPHGACLEALFFAKNRSSAMGVSESIGVILAELARGNIEVQELTPIQIKQSVTGDGRADKNAVQMMVRRLLALSENPQPDHAADALAAAIAGSRYISFQKKVSHHV